MGTAFTIGPCLPIALCTSQRSSRSMKVANATSDIRETADAPVKNNMQTLWGWNQYTATALLFRMLVKYCTFSRVLSGVFWNITRNIAPWTCYWGIIGLWEFEIISLLLYNRIVQGRSPSRLVLISGWTLTSWLAQYSVSVCGRVWDFKTGQETGSRG